MKFFVVKYFANGLRVYVRLKCCENGKSLAANRAIRRCPWYCRPWLPRTAPRRAFTWDTGRGFLEVCPAPRLPASCMFEGKPGFLGSLKKKKNTHKTCLHLVLILWGNIAVKKSWLCLILIYLFSFLASFDASGL